MRKTDRGVGLFQRLVCQFSLRLLIGLVLVRGVWTVVKDPRYPLLAGERVRIGLLGQRSRFGP